MRKSNVKFSNPLIGTVVALTGSMPMPNLFKHGDSEDGKRSKFFLIQDASNSNQIIFVKKKRNPMTRKKGDLALLRTN